jgi:hypothetical protein
LLVRAGQDGVEELTRRRWKQRIILQDVKVRIALTLMLRDDALVAQPVSQVAGRERRLAGPGRLVAVDRGKPLISIGHARLPQVFLDRGATGRIAIEVDVAAAVHVPPEDNRCETASRWEKESMRVTRFVPVVQRRAIEMDDWLMPLAAPLFSIDTHMTMEERGFLLSVAVGLPERFVACEIGSYVGASAAFIAAAASVKSGHVHCIDTWDGRAMEGEEPRDSLAEFRRNTQRFERFITIHRGESKALAASIPLELDFLFVDGDHSYEGAIADLGLYVPKLKTGAVLLMHDFNRESVRRAWEDFSGGGPRARDFGAVGVLQSFQILSD